MIEIVKDTIIDNLKILPFLFIAFLLIELFEHKLSKKSTKTLQKSKKFGPMFGSLVGIFPQCGFSVIATNLYITRIITLGTLIAVYLSTSDEMLPILIAEKASSTIIIKILFIKFIIGIIAGFIIDSLIRKKEKINYKICTDEHCNCENNIIKSTFIHTFKTLIYIFIITLIINTLFHYIGEEYIKTITKENSILSIFITSLIGLIPNCGPSVILTELYLNKIIAFGPVLAGLLTNSGVGLLMLFKNNKNIKENIMIIGILYAIGIIAGLLFTIIPISQ